MGSTIGGGTYVLENQIEQIPKKIVEFFDELISSKNAIPWFDFIRQCRHPDVLWKIDFIEPRSEMKDLNKYILKSENLLYTSKTNIIINQEYKTDIYQEVCFHTIRAYLRAEENNFDDAITILESLYTWIDKLSLVRKSNLLMHLFCSHLCMREFDKSYKYFKEHWFLLKTSSMADRFNEGIWDNMSIMYNIVCFFIENTDEYKLFLSTKDDIELDNLHKHKKIGLMYLLKHDHSWVVSFLSLAFYKKACSLMGTLPEYKIRDTTPRNKNSYLPLTRKIKSQEYAGWQQHYYEKLIREISIDGAKIEIIDNMLFSFYYFDQDHKKYKNIEQDLFDFLRQNSEQENQIIYAGCGIGFSQKKFCGSVTSIDIADQIIYECERLGLIVKQIPVEKFVATTTNLYDLIFACGLLEHFSEYQIDMLLDNNKCYNNICFYIETNEKYLFTPSFGNLPFHRTHKQIDWWKIKFEKYFNCIFEEAHDGFFVYGTKK